jgi:serine/threonine protein kinase
VPDSTVLTSALSLEILRRELRGYEVVREVGHGAMGIVYEAEQHGIGRRVAVKVLPPNLALRERTVKRFLREAEAMGRLAHPGIVDVFEVATQRELNYFSMKFVEGPPLDRVLKAGPLAVHDVLSIGIQVADALAHAHSRGVLHRDIKPANLLRDGERVILTDFGLARPIDSEDGGSMTESGDLVGTPLYMAPEQISGDSERVDGRADVWGLGVTLYELLAGRTPFVGPNAQGILHSILHRDPPRLRKQRDDVPRDLEAVVLKCMEKDSGRRYATSAALCEDLKAVRDGRAVSATRPRPWDPLVRWVRRHPAEASVMGAIALAAGALLFYWRDASKKLHDVSAQRDVAEAQRSESFGQQNTYLHQKRETWARYELALVREEAAAIRQESERHAFSTELAAALGGSLLPAGFALPREIASRLAAFGPEPKQVAERRSDLSERLVDLLDLLPPALHRDVVAEVIEMQAAWSHESGLDDDRVMEMLDRQTADQPLQEQLSARAAVRAGQGRLVEAFALHLDRARLAPSAAEPRLGAARVLRRMAATSKVAGDLDEGRAHLGQALRLLARAIELAVASDDKIALQRILIERALCLLDLGDPRSALRDVDQLLARDPTDFSAYSAKLACDRALRQREAAPDSTALAQAPLVEGSPEAGSGDSTPALDEEIPALSIERLLPGRAELTDSLQGAGRDLQSIYRGLHQLLRDPETDPAADPEADPADAPPPSGGAPNPAPPRGN